MAVNDLLTRLWRLGKPLQWRFLRLVHFKFICGITGVVRDDDGHVLLLRHRGHLGGLHYRARPSARRRRPYRAARTDSKGTQAATDGRSSPAELVRPPGGGGAGAEGLGRSRGGFTAKIHLSADGRCRPLSLLITEGQRADCTQFEAVLDKIRVPRPVGRPRRKPGSVAADKTYSNSLIRRYLS